MRIPRGKIFVGLGIITAATVVVLVLRQPQPVAHSSVVRPVATQEQKAFAGAPVSIQVPRIAVDAPIDPMGVLPNGDMQAPEGAVRTGWYKLGPHPGNEGSAVIAGHFGRWKNGEASVFDDLHTLQPGDKVMVRDDAGAIITFVVRQTRVFGRDDDAKAIFVSNDGKAHLNLITCQGTWEASKKTYSDRLVVFTDRE